MRDVILLNLHFDGWSFTMVPFLFWMAGRNWRAIKNVVTAIWRMCTIRMQTQVATHEKVH